VDLGAHYALSFELRYLLCHNSTIFKPQAPNNMQLGDMDTARDEAERAEEAKDDSQSIGEDLSRYRRPEDRADAILKGWFAAGKGSTGINFTQNDAAASAFSVKLASTLKRKHAEDPNPDSVETKRSKPDVAKATLDEESPNELGNGPIMIGMGKGHVVRARGMVVTPNWEEEFEPCRRIPVGGTIDPPADTDRSWVIRKSYPF
jgi:hypothetical protein